MSVSKRIRLFAGSAAGCGAAALIVAGAYWSGAHAAPQDLSQAEPTYGAPAGAPPSFANLIQRVAPAVVSIDVTKKLNPRQVQFSGGQTPFQFFFPFGSGGQGQDQGDGDDGGNGNANPFQGLPGFGQGGGNGPTLEQATGSGFFISPDGYIVTNNHVIADATSITVRLADKRQLKARLVGRDPATDLAVIKVEGGGFSYVSFEERAKPRVGDWVVAVGNPYDLGGTATAGIVSALGREHVSGSSFVDYMQIDAPINRGNSGGPTFDVYGRVVGVNSAIYSETGGSIGIGFAIPADVAAQVTRQLIDYGKVTRGYIGAEIQGVSPDIASSLGIDPNKGALVAELTPGGPSARAGLQVGDVIVGVNGRPVSSAEALTREVALVHPGQMVALQLLRNGRPMTIEVRSGQRPSEDQLAANDDRSGGGDDGDAREGSAGARVLGMRLAPLDEATRQRFGLAERQQGGVVVEGVGQDSDAADKGLHSGDVIIRAGERRVASPADVSAAVAEAKANGRPSVLLLVSRNGRTTFVPVNVAPSAAG